ncbi:MAG: tannase, partial [Eubacterium sp.]|nr:tannase [Eubacterium sp.]
MKKKILSVFLTGVLILTGIGVYDLGYLMASPAKAEVKTSLSKISSSAWSYNSSSNVYYQTGISYCQSPADSSYENMGIFVPGDYMNATSNGDGTYTCTVNTSAKVGNYTASTAPMVLPVNTAGYSAMTPPSAY